MARRCLVAHDRFGLGLIVVQRRDEASDGAFSAAIPHRSDLARQHRRWNPVRLCFIDPLGRVLLVAFQ